MQHDDNALERLKQIKQQADRAGAASSPPRMARSWSRRSASSRTAWIRPDAKRVNAMSEETPETEAQEEKLPPCRGGWIKSAGYIL